jgi:hypothetical protein
MTITINGTTGIAGVDGSAGTPAVQGTDTNTGVFFGTDTVTIATGGTAAVTVDSGQRTKFPTTIGVGNATPSTSGSGITFPATASASSNANTLDDYEEGTFTVTTNSDATGTISAQTAQYTKVGNICIVRIVFQVGVNFTNSLIGGLPFTSDGGDSPSGVGSTGIAITSSASASPIVCQIGIGGTTAGFYSGTNTGSAHNPNTTNSIYRLSFVYRTT